VNKLARKKKKGSTINIENFSLISGKKRFKITNIQRATRNTSMYRAGMPKGEKYVYSFMSKNVKTGELKRLYIYADSKSKLVKKFGKEYKKY